MRVTTDEINQAKEIPLIDFINANGIDINREGNGNDPYYRLQDHDSLVIKGEKFFWNSRQEGGYGSISFAMSYYELKFPEAVKRVNEHEYGSYTQIESSEKQPFKYPVYFEVNDTQNIRDYLVGTRKIDSRVVDWCIKKDLLVQDKKDNAVFKWKDLDGNIVGGDRQGTREMDNKRGTFKQIMPNSKEDGGFTIDVGKQPDKIAVFESPIDMLSYWSIEKENVQNTRLLSMSGLKLQALVSSMRDLKDNGHNINKIISCVDNDKAGNEFHEKLRKVFNPTVLVDHRPTQTKDWNDELKHSFSSTRTTHKQQSYGM